MCDDLSNALELQEQLGSDTTKGAVMLFRAAAKSMNKLSNQIKEHIEDSDKRDIKINARLDKIDERLERIEKKSEDATKWQLVVKICQALFGDIKRTITTFIMIGVLLGLVHFKDILDIIKALVI